MHYLCHKIRIMYLSIMYDVMFGDDVHFSFDGFFSKSDFPFSSTLLNRCPASPAIPMPAGIAISNAVN